MKFKIRYADQIVGFLAIAAIAALVVVIFLLGSKQRWFARDYQFKTEFETASGLSNGLQIQYKGFTVGKVKSYKLNKEDRVDVEFYIYDTYYDRVKEGSLIEFAVSPIPGLGNAFLFHPGNGSVLISEGSFIPRSDSEEGKRMIEAGLVTLPKKDDTVANILAQINPILSNLNGTLAQVNGTAKGPLADTIRNAADMTGDLSSSMGPLLANLEAMLADVKAITAHIERTTASIGEADGLVPRLIDPDGVIFDNIGQSLAAVKGTLENVEDSSSILKSQVPQIARLIEDIRIALEKGQDVLEALKNNPILKGGVPQRVEANSSGTNARNIDF